MKLAERRSSRRQNQLKASSVATTTRLLKERRNNFLKGSKTRHLSTQNSGQIKCAFCRRRHFIYKCKYFLVMSLSERKKFIMDNDMCFGCLRVGHFVKDCKRKITCNICKQGHLPPLHQDKPQRENLQSCTHTLMIVQE